MMDKKKLSHYRDTDLTVAELKSCVGFEHLSDEQLQEFIATIKEFTMIIFNYYRRRNTKKNLE